VAEPKPLHTIEGMKLSLSVGPQGETQLSWGLFGLPQTGRWLFAAFPYLFYFAWGYGLWRAGTGLWHNIAHGFAATGGRVFWATALFEIVWLAAWLAAGIYLYRLLAVVPRLTRSSVITLSGGGMRYEPVLEADFSPEDLAAGKEVPRIPFKPGRPRSIQRTDVRRLEMVDPKGTPQLAIYTEEENFLVGIGLEEPDIRRLERELRRWLGWH
jgi:hypothetical protein